MEWIALIVFLMASVAAFILAAARVVMHPARPRVPAVPDGGIAVAFAAPDGVNIRGWHFPLPGAKGTVVYGPGRGRGLNGWDFRYIPLFARAGYSLLMFDSRGQGNSDGVASLGALEWKDFLGAVDYLAGLGVRRVAFCGGSQGAATGIMAAARCPAAVAVIAESCYATWRATLYHALRVYGHIPAPLARPAAWLLGLWLQWRLGFRAEDAEPVSAIGRIAPRAVLLIHGPRDPYIPMADAERVFAAAGEPKQLWVIPEAGHTQGLELRPQEYERRLTEFLDRYLAEPPQGAGPGSSSS